MSVKRIPKLSFQTWSAEWKVARRRTGDVDAVVKLWKTMPTHGWTREQLVDVLGFRKNNKKDVGEQAIERLLLGPRGTKREHSFLLDNRCFAFEAHRHAMALSKHRTGQVITDAIGTVQVGGKRHPLAIEIKKTQGDCWSAVVQNMQQVRMLRAQERKTKEELGADGGAWGIVLAPKAYFDRDLSALRASQQLLERLKECTDLRIGLCYSDGLPEERIECFWSNWHTGRSTPCRAKS
jgi:hypothetical protein